MCSVTPLLLLPVLGCGPDGDRDDTAAADQPPWAGWEAEWFPCSLYEGEDDGLAECSATTMPLRWDDPDDDRTIEIWAKRLPAPEGTDRQIWLLDGGPGASGLWDFGARMAYVQARDPNATLYTLDHRGTGYSERLGCDAEAPGSSSGTSIASGEYPDCIAQIQEDLGDRLEAYTSTQSSHDLAAYVEATREAGVPVFVWGGSYGSYWAQRYLAVAPEQADGAIVEGIIPIDGTLILSEPYTDLAAMVLFGRCAEDATCAARLGEDPWGRLADVLARMEAGHCTSSGLSASLVRALFAYLMYSRAGMSVIPAATWRLDRCEEADEDAIVHLYYALFGDGGAWDIEAYSILLQHHVGFSEIWDHPDFEGVDLDAWYDDLYAEALVVKGYGHTKVEIYEQWPRYADPDWDDRWPETDTPMLMLQGELDPVTPHALALAVPEHLDGAHQHFVTFPHSAHGSSFDSPVDGGDEPCGFQMVQGFLADPTAPPETACVERTLPVDFDPGAAYADYWFGTEAIWD
ncbi:MAG: alpha/beta hydrolase [Deltaproteobacteria bacterium]|nr:alpha/beta hydrolase [Deltaproteobacteria bacterium]